MPGDTYLIFYLYCNLFVLLLFSVSVYCLTVAEFFFPTGEPWTERELTYAIHRYPQNTVLSQAAVDEEIALAFAVWASVSDLVFRQVSGKADINISFFRGQHGDRKPFDGRGMILGHASKPMDGTVHFDDDEPWSIRRFSGKKITIVPMRFEVFTLVKIQAVFWLETLCSLVGGTSILEEYTASFFRVEGRRSIFLENVDTQLSDYVVS
jgi:hypothetical protein